MSSTRLVSLVGSDGVRRVLDAAGAPYELGTDIALAGLAPIETRTRRLAGVRGANVEAIETLPRDLAVPVYISGGTEAELDTAIEELSLFLQPGAECRITYGRAGHYREIVGRYKSGAEAIVVADHTTREVVARLVFTCYDPFWRRLSNCTETYSADFENGFAALMNEFWVFNGGHVPVWPEFEITGKIENVEALNLRDGGKAWRMTEQMLATTDVMVIRTDPKSQTGCWLNGADSQWFLDPHSEFWQLLPGWNPIKIRGVDVENVGNIGGFEIRWQERYNSC